MHIHIGHHFFGAGNIGDDWMLGGFLRAAQSAGRRDRITCSIFSDPTPMRLRFPQVEWMPYERSLREAQIAACDVWLGLGDTPFQKDTGNWLYSHLMEELALCSTHKKPMYLLGVGVESEHAVEAPEAVALIGSCSGIWTRDNFSFRCLERSPLSKGRLHESADLAHIHFAGMRREALQPTGRTALVINVEKSEQLSLSALEQFIASSPNPPLDWIAQEVRSLEISEVKLWGQFSEVTRARLRLRVPDYATGTLESFYSLYEGCSKLIGSRYHSSVAGAWAGASVSVFTRSGKIFGLAEQLGLGICSGLRSATEIAAGLEGARSVEPALLRKLAAKAEDGCQRFFEAASMTCSQKTRHRIC